jgi:selenocysteine-specific translation elongation factor
MTINTTKIADEGKAREMMRGIAAGVRFYKYSNGHYPASLTDVQPYADDWRDIIEGAGSKQGAIRK